MFFEYTWLKGCFISPIEADQYSRVKPPGHIGSRIEVGDEATLEVMPLEIGNGAERIIAPLSMFIYW
jgi:hypothetical protein